MAGKSKKYYFLQISENFFRIKDIKKLRQLPKGDTYIVVYMKIMLSTLKDGGVLYYDDLEEDIASELALQIEEPLEDVQATLDFLFKRGIMQKKTASEYEIVTVPEMLGSEGDSARRMREWRKKQKMSQSDESLSLCDHLVTEPQKSCDTDIEQNIQIREKKKDTSISENKATELQGFAIPTVEDVRAYCTEQGYHIDPQAFVDFYQAKGWRIGGDNMIDWRACVRSWERRAQSDKPVDITDPASYAGLEEMSL